MAGRVGDEGLIHTGKALGLHDPSKASGPYQDVLSFKVDSAYSSGFVITAKLLDAGWAHKGEGAEEGISFNSFWAFRLISNDTSNYVGNRHIRSVLPLDWPTNDTSSKTFRNGSQSRAMTNWEDKAQAKWGKASNLVSGEYSQILRITIAAAS